MLGDLRVLAAEDGRAELLLDTERATLQALFDMVRRFKIGYDVELHKRTVQRGLLSLLGPGARAVAGAGDLPAEEHAHRAGEIAGHEVRLIVTDARHRRALPRRGHRGRARGAAGRRRDGRLRGGRRDRCASSADARATAYELDDSTIPQEAGLNERAVSFTKGCYVGQETVARLFYRGKPNRHLRGLKLSEPGPSGHRAAPRGARVGRLATSLVSPAHGPIALALVRREAAPGDTVDGRGRRHRRGRRAAVRLSLGAAGEGRHEAPDHPPARLRAEPAQEPRPAADVAANGRRDAPASFRAHGLRPAHRHPGDPSPDRGRRSSTCRGRPARCSTCS